MIPKRAIFYWEGAEPSWLRRQSWESFARLNPDWEIVKIDGRLVPIEGTSRMAIAQRSDMARYMEIASNGGFYFDTDIAFFKPVPEAWLDADVAVPMDRGLITHIGVLGGVPKNIFYEHLVQACLRRIETDPIPLGYQSLGVSLTHGWNVPNYCDPLGIRWYPIPHGAVIGAHWQAPEMAWGPNGTEWRTGAIGLHWFGNDHLSQELEPKATAENLVGTMIGRALGL